MRPHFRPDQSSFLLRLSRLRRFTIVALVMAVLVTSGLLAPGTARAAGPSTTNPATAQRQNADRQKQVDAELNAATASEDQLHAELARLDSQVKAEEARAQEALLAQARALEEVAAIKVEVDAAAAALGDARSAAAQSAVLAYMRPDRETASQVLSAKDPQAFGKMHALVKDVARHHNDVIQERAIAETLLRQKKAAADEAQRRADEAAAQAQAGYDNAARARDQRVAVRAELTRRINDLKSEQAALDAQEGQLRALIARQQAAVATPATTSPPRTTPPTTRAATPGNPTPTTRTPTTTKAPPTTARPPTTGQLAWPVNGVVTSGYGMRDGRMHQGIDIGVPMATPIRASAAGSVFFSGTMSGYGNVILIDHGNGTVTLYAHQSALGVAVGARVSSGQVIGAAGSTGHSTGPHVHFEVRVNGTPLNPMGYLG